MAVRMASAARQRAATSAVLLCRVSLGVGLGWAWWRGWIYRSLALLAARGGPLPHMLLLLVFSAFANPKEVEFSLFIWLTCSCFALLMGTLKCISLFLALA